MGLRTKRLNGTETEPFSCEVQIQLPAASIVLWHMASLPGAQVIAKKSWAMTDDFEAYFLYKGRLFVLETPFVNLWLSLIGQPGDEPLFAEVETHLQRFSHLMHVLTPFALLRFLLTPYNPPQKLLREHGIEPAK